MMILDVALQDLTPFLLMKTDPIRSFNTEIENIAKTKGGDAKYKALIENLNKESAETRSKFLTEKAKATKAELDPCFAAGTLVHTINGLVPIEQIKVGDLVLSKPEDGGGRGKGSGLAKQHLSKLTSTNGKTFKNRIPRRALYLGDAEFADKSRQTLSNRLLKDAEIPRLQRRARVAPLEVFAAMPDRNSAIAKAYASGRYSQKEIASAFEIHYATVSRIVKVKTDLPPTPP